MPINIERETISQCVLKGEKSFEDFPTEICLSPRGVEILELKAMGLVNKQIVWKLGLSPDTIKNFVTSALQKSGRNTAGTVYALVESGKISR